ncbi:hypothetical protein [Filimonas effusa]|uniref:YtkA-like domain-containing protein n=1 Tax=Filimonas effusa TaxID=2508721 RepID=A0A4Q1D2G3_9BACT|nr:hypothetical protein [Filimonas effusa]RXK81974.1 hypothetical protein ESB13_19535 [Filimonas effusa]
MQLKNKITYPLLALFVSLFALSCSKDSSTPDTNETADLQQVITLSNDTHELELYTANGSFYSGYNEIFLRIKNKDGSFVNNASVTWVPTMQMASMRHSCPYSAVAKTSNTHSLYGGSIIFQMASNDAEHWELAISYTIDGQPYTALGRIMVREATKRTINVFRGTDNVNYILALVAPAKPQVAQNVMSAVLYKAEGMSGYTVVNNFKVKIDPRMPGMNNHSSPNNRDLVQAAAGGLYEGLLSLTMTGYWKINLQLEDASGNVLKGEKVTEANESSSIYFEIEF